MREPEKILEQVSSWRPESLAAYERRRRAQRTTEHDRLMAEAERMWAAEMEREREAAKGGRPKSAPSLKGTGVIRLDKGRASQTRKAKPAKVVAKARTKRSHEPLATVPAELHGTRRGYDRGCGCVPCRSAESERVRLQYRSRKANPNVRPSTRRAGQAGERAA